MNMGYGSEPAQPSKSYVQCQRRKVRFKAVTAGLGCNSTAGHLPAKCKVVSSSPSPTMRQPFLKGYSRFHECGSLPRVSQHWPESALNADDVITQPSCRMLKATEQRRFPYARVQGKPTELLHSVRAESRAHTPVWSAGFQRRHTHHKFPVGLCC